MIKPTRRTKRHVKELSIAAGIGALLMLGVSSAASWYHETYSTEVRSPIILQNPVVIEKRPTIPTIAPTRTVTPFLSPSPTPTPRRRSGIIKSVDASERITTGPEQYIIDKIHAVFGKDGETAVKVARAESGLRYNAQNACCAGLFQIHRIHKAKYEGENIYDVDTNIRVAYEIFKAQGWGPWEVCQLSVDCK